ncbi:NAD(P)H-dependent flavin oxidoreductase [Ichthyobacterium seriolicida]|uniref:2-nitropropane dioxygenase n=1 Tax=Ichthyobacterium seriolicida TaxID=242600 RepID=A0A1J1E7R9_9FLAO|nr:nitronate monooxygenase family protein [Ichthyobacterium seriolicida]BAV95382.1 2-nitropropane dioxygenase [Ichthyobacterium seriolicida]
MKIDNRLTKMLNIELPVIMAPMFLVSNEAMVKSAIDNGIAGCFPSLNFRKDGELKQVIDNLIVHNNDNSFKKGTFGVNLIVQKSNPLYKKHLSICVERKVPFYITSLGNPREVIREAHNYGAKVFCDVTNMDHAQKCYDMGCDGFIAVGQGAGGHAGNFSLQLLVPSLNRKFPDKIVISAGGIANGSGIASMLALGSEGVSIGTLFIASKEATVSQEYKDAILDAKMKDIVLTEKISGTPCTIINTEYAKKIGYKQNWFERLIQRNKTIKKYFKMLVQLRGMKKLNESVKPGSYKTLWCAGQSVELIDKVKSIETIVEDLRNEMKIAIDSLNKTIS